MLVSSMSKKHLRDAIKHGYTTDDLTVKYECTAEDLEYRIGQLYSQNNPKVIKEIYNDLEANRKKNQKKKVDAPEVVSTTDLVTGDEMVFASVENIEELPVVPLIKTLDDLRAEEKVLSNTLIQLEGEHKKHAEKRVSIRRHLEDLKNKITEIEATLKKLGEEYEQKMAEANSLAEEMNKLCVPIREKRSALESLRREIEERQKVTIYVYEDGRIEVPDNPEFVIDDTGYEELRNQLHEKEECLDLRLRDITTLARLLTITKDVEQINLACDVSVLEEAYHSISGK